MQRLNCSECGEIMSNGILMDWFSIDYHRLKHRSVYRYHTGLFNAIFQTLWNPSSHGKIDRGGF